MPRSLSTVLLLALLAATAVAFAVTEGLKLEPSPIRSVYVDRIFSPTCDCDTNTAAIRFRTRKSDRLTLSLVDADGVPVRLLLGPRATRPGIVTASWDGRDDSGRIVADGDYRPRVHFQRQRRTIVLPNPITVDTKPPQVSLLHLRPSFFSPDGDGHRDKVVAAFRSTEPARPLLFVNGHRRVVGKFARTNDKVEWYGRADGRALPAGPYRITLAARDLAGNLSSATDAQWVKIRYVSFSRLAVRTRAGARFRVRVGSDAALLRWRFAGRRGTTRPGPLVLRAPAQPGRYRLFVEEHGHAAALPVVVRPKV